MNVIERYESAAQGLVRSAPIVFQRAHGAELFDESGRRYIDFNSGGGTLGYGHNSLRVCSALIDYICKDHVLQTRDKTSVAKRAFIEAFVAAILTPRGMNYKLLFTDPASGTAAEIALRIARRDRKRNTIAAFTHSNHGLTDGAPRARPHAGALEAHVRRGSTVFLPYCGYLVSGTDTTRYLRRIFEDGASGLERPAAVIVATAQAECGVELASGEWLRALEDLCRECGVLLIADETLTGCGRMGPFFSFEAAGLKPDMVIVSHALAGGLPLSLLLLRPELDRWRHGEQAGVFQGDGLSLVAATELLSLWKDASLTRQAEGHAQTIGERLNTMTKGFGSDNLSARGAGMLWGLELNRPASAAVVAAWALEQGVIVEPAPARDDALLLLPPVTIDQATLEEGLERLQRAVDMFLAHAGSKDRALAAAHPSA
jgi:diaminobutyrate-2-oxoglutarate transaminase